MSSNTWIISVLTVYFTSLLWLGIKAAQQVTTLSDYILGGRKLGPVIGAMNAGASDMSSWLLMGLPGAFYLFGMNQAWMVIGLVIGSWSCWTLIAPRLRVYSELLNDSLTVPTFLERRFHDETGILRLISSISIIMFFLVYISSGLLGAAKLFSSSFNLSYHLTLVIGTIIIVAYTCIGGFLAVSWADLLQGTLILLALLVTPVVMVAYNNDFHNILNNITRDSPHYFNIFRNFNLWQAITLMGWGLGYFGQPHIISKYMAIKKVVYLKTARNICTAWMIISMLGAVMVGIIGRGIFINSNIHSELVFIISAQKFFHPLLTGILFAAILSAIMSTINGQLIICASNLIEDFYVHRVKKNNPQILISHKKTILLSRLSIVLFSTIVLILAWEENNTILKLVGIAWSGLGASIGPVMLTGLFTPKISPRAAIAGIVTGTISSFLFSYIQIFHYEIFPSFLCSLMAIYIFNIGTKNNISPEIEKEFNQMKQNIKSATT